MKWRGWLVWLLVCLPVMLAALLLLLFSYGDFANPRIRFTIGANLSNWLLLVGGLLSLLLTLVVGVWQWRDQVNRARLQEQQTQASAERRRFLQRLDHELKNPLMAMRAGLANLTVTTDGAQAETVQSIDAQTVRLSRLTADLRKIAELENRLLEYKPVDLAQLLAEAVELAEDQAKGQRRLTLIVPQAPWPLPTVPGDWDLLFLAIHNLIDNALKFTETGAAIEVRAREDGAYVVIEVADTGPGIESSELPLIWEELYRGKNAPRATGSGLGLALVKAIIERHRGRIALKSRVGQGTVVTVRLPAG